MEGCIKMMLLDDPDKELTLAQKLELIKWIPIRQQERWERMKRFHRIQGITIGTRHFFMRNEIKLMREQRERFMRLKREILT